MLKDIIKAAFLAIGIALIAMVIVGGTAGGSGLSQIISNIGLILFILSPAIAIWRFRYMRKKARLAAQAAYEISEQEQEASEQNRRDFLRKRFLERERLIDSIDRHRSALKRNLERAIKRNDYGAIEENRTGEALLEFFSSIDLNANYIEYSEAIEIVFEQIELRVQQDRMAGFDASNLPFDGHAFEKWVAEGLTGFGWEADVTAGSGDQGIDVIATKNGKRIGLQCKLYSQAIGNKAVQEAHSGKTYYNLDAAGVMTNSSFTSSANDLASVTGIFLLSHHDIPNLYETMFGPSLAGARNP